VDRWVSNIKTKWQKRDLKKQTDCTVGVQSLSFYMKRNAKDRSINDFLIIFFSTMWQLCVTITRRVSTSLSQYEAGGKWGGWQSNVQNDKTTIMTNLQTQKSQIPTVIWKLTPSKFDSLPFTLLNLITSNFHKKIIHHTAQYNPSHKKSIQMF